MEFYCGHDWAAGSKMTNQLFLMSIMKQQINGAIEVKDFRTDRIVNVALSIIDS
jgi:hypothetical protein